MRARRAKTVPPGAAMEPRMVQAERKVEMVVRISVNMLAVGPLGGHVGWEEESGTASTVRTVLGDGLAR